MIGLRATRWWIGAVFVLAALLGVRAGVDAAPVRSGLRPGAIGRGPVTREGKPPRGRGEIPATAGVATGPTMTGGAVYPAQDIPLRFTHGQHLALGLNCARCHPKASTSTKAADLLVPTGAACDECHGAQHPKPEGGVDRCAMCHSDVDDAGRVKAGLRMPRPLLRFNHRLHAGKSIDCENCHPAMDRVRLASTLQLPREAKCLECHDGFTATSRCDACHPAGGDGRLLIRAQDDRTLPALVPKGASSWGATHDLAFVEDHVAIARANPRLCQSCHDETFCVDCHDGPVRPLRIHAGDYLTLHAMDARAATSDCQSCHRTQSFCLGCHERLGFGERDAGEFGTGGGLRFHPEDWSGPPGTPQTHAHAAQRNIAACTSCHTEDTCLACHATTGAITPGLGVSPHGPNFARSPRCGALSSHNRRVCLRCHAPGDPQLECM